MTKNFGSLFESLFLCFGYLKSTLAFLNLLVYFCFSTTPWGYWVRSRSKKIKKGYRTCLPLESKQYNCIKLFKTYTTKSAISTYNTILYAYQKLSCILQPLIISLIYRDIIYSAQIIQTIPNEVEFAFIINRLSVFELWFTLL